MLYFSSAILQFSYSICLDDHGLQHISPNIINIKLHIHAVGVMSHSLGKLLRRKQNASLIPYAIKIAEQL